MENIEIEKIYTSMKNDSDKADEIMEFKKKLNILHEKDIELYNNKLRSERTLKASYDIMLKSENKHSIIDYKFNYVNHNRINLEWVLHLEKLKKEEEKLKSMINDFVE